MRRLYRTDGTTQDFDKPMTITECRKAIGADTLDTVQLRHLGYPRMVMFVDDAGHEKRMPVNEEATQLYWSNCKPGTTHQIRGDVVVVPDEDFA